jgi:hypothetical protein
VNEIRGGRVISYMVDSGRKGLLAKGSSELKVRTKKGSLSSLNHEDDFS